MVLVCDVKISQLGRKNLAVRFNLIVRIKLAAAPKTPVDGREEIGEILRGARDRYRRCIWLIASRSCRTCCVRQTFVRRCHGEHGFIARPAGYWHQNMTARSPPWSREVLGAASATLPVVDPRFIGISTFSRTCPRRRTCCFAPNICSSLPWWLGFIPGLPRIGNSAGFFILSQLPAWAKKAPRTCRKRGAGPLSDRKSQSIVRLSKDQGGPSVLLDTPVVNCVFNRRQYNFVIGPIPVLYAQAAD